MKLFQVNLLTLLLLVSLACNNSVKLRKSNAFIQNTSDTVVLKTVIPRNEIKEIEPTVQFEWISPSQAVISIKSHNSKLELMVKILSNLPITLDNITILINGKESGNKADELMLKVRPDFKDQILTTAIDLEKGINKVQIIVNAGENHTFFTERNMEKSENGFIKILNPTMNNSPYRIYWLKPDKFSLDGLVLQTKEGLIEVMFSIISPVEIMPEKILIYHNEEIMKPSNSFKFSGLNGNYQFKDILKLKEDVVLNELSLGVITDTDTVKSEILKVSYSPLRPNLYILSIGTKTNLNYSVKDARDFSAIFTNQGTGTHRIYNSIFIDTLLGERANCAEIRGMIEAIGNKWKTGVVANDDLIMIFISSHGFIDEQGHLRIQGNDYLPERRRSTSVSYFDDIVYHLDKLPCKKVIFIDACHSGGARANPADVNNALISYRNAKPGTAVIASSSESQESYEDPLWENGAFTYALKMALLSGQGDLDKNGIITLDELEKNLVAEVPTIVKKVKDRFQVPAIRRNEIGNIPLYLVKINNK